MPSITKGACGLRTKLRPVPVLTQKQLSRKLGVTQQAISAWLRGIARPDPRRRALLESLTGIAVGDWDVAAEVGSGGDLRARAGGEG